MFNNIFHHHKNVWRDRHFVISTIVGVLSLIVSLIANYFAGTYASNVASSPVSDLILNILPIVNVDEIYIEGFFIFVLFIAIVAFYNPKTIPFILKSVALFVVVRCFFIILTHIGPPPQHAPTDSGTPIFNFTGDLFFSGHTGIPYLLALIFWSNLRLRITFLAFSAVFAVTVLLGHFHYSIDVFAAYFVTYAIFAISKKFFAKDYKFINQ